MIRIINADCLSALRTLPEKSVNTCITSPPYFGLRDYGAAGQIGLEPTPEEFVAALVEVFREVRRVLRDDGTLWLNLGDSYAGSGRGGNPTANTSTLQGGNKSQEASMVRRTRNHNEVGATARQAATTGHANRMRSHGELKQKDLIGIPWMVAFALRADGWYLRQDIIWSKPNPMPESVEDRCTKSHEYLFLLSKSETYYYDQEAIMEPIAAASVARLSQPNLEDQVGSDRVPGNTNGPMKAVSRKSGNIARKPSSERGTPSGTGKNQAGNVPWEGTVRNRRSVWTVSTQGFPGQFCTACGVFFDGAALTRLKTETIKKAGKPDERRRWCLCGRHDAWLSHFATFPPALIEQCILAGSPEDGVVLDPFGGAGTTGLVADRAGRDAILIELNPHFAAMARQRVEGDAGMFSAVEKW